MTMRPAILLAAAMTVCAGPRPAVADELGPDRARALVEMRRILPLEEILRRNAASLDGQILELELETDARRFSYKIRMLRRDGRVDKVWLDAETGAVLKAR